MVMMMVKMEEEEKMMRLMNEDADMMGDGP